MNEKNELQQVKKSGITEAKNLGDVVNNRVVDLCNNGRLVLPQNYVVGNAISSAYLILQDTKDKNGKPVLETCTKESITNALLNMAILGLNPAKKQCYFIAYGNQLSLFTSYFGKQAVIKRQPSILSEPTATLIYEGDSLEIEFNELNEPTVVNHKTSWQNMVDGKIAGAYAVVKQKQKDGKVVVRSAVMTIKDIDEAFDAQKIINPKYSYSRPHDNFRGEFCKRTILNRLVKNIIQTSNDDDLVGETLMATDDDQFEFNATPEERVVKEINTNANTGEVIGTPKIENKNPFKASAKFSDEELNEIYKEEEQIEETPAEEPEEYDPFA